MTTEKKGCLAFAVCGSFCTLEDALGAAQALTAQGDRKSVGRERV